MFSSFNRQDDEFLWDSAELCYLFNGFLFSRRQSRLSFCRYFFSFLNQSLLTITGVKDKENNSFTFLGKRKVHCESLSFGVLLFGAGYGPIPKREESCHSCTQNHQNISERFPFIGEFQATSHFPSSFLLGSQFDAFYIIRHGNLDQHAF